MGMRTVVRILGCLRKYWLATLGAYLCLICTSAVDLSVPWLIRRIIDCGMRVGLDAQLLSRDCPAGMEPMGVVAQSLAWMITLVVLKGFFHFGQGYLGAYSAQRVAYDLRRRLAEHLHRLSFSWHDRTQTGHLMARATTDVNQLRRFTSRAVIQFVHFIIISAGIGFILFALNWMLALASLVTLPFLMRAAAQYGRRVRPLFHRAQEEIAALASIVQENLAGARVVRAFARERDQIEKFERQNDLLVGQYLAAARVQSYTSPLMDLIANLSTVIVIWFGGILVIRGVLSVGELVAFNAYLLLVIGPARRLGFLIGQAARALAAGERIFEVLDAPVDVEDRPNAIVLPRLEGAVEFQNVTCMYYPGAPVLENVTFKAQPGEVLALLGATGSGKTTIVNLIPRFYDVTAGRVLIDGHDVRDIQLRSLRRQIGMVMQDTALFAGTIRDNIAFGVPDATEDRIVAAAKASHAHEFISSHAGGYDTVVGERGITLSGGQRQRIAIARALLLNPSILILDDFTSAVDTETEAMIREALERLLRGRTVFVIAHRVRTVREADQIIVMDRGKIAGAGSHEQLLVASRLYRELCRTQLVDGARPAEASHSDGGRQASGRHH